MTEPERQTMEADIVCVGFGPATGGFLTALAKRMTNPDGTPALPSRVAPGMPPQILVYERADDVGAGVSGVVTRARGIRAHLADEDLKQIPLATPVRRETTLYLLDPIGASRRSPLLRMADSIFRATRAINPWWDADSVALPVDPPFMSHHGGWLLSIGQFHQWVA